MIKLLFYTLFFLFSLSSQTIVGQTVLKKMKRKDRHIAVIDVGKLSGYIKGTNVCFYNDTGRKAACGKVVYAKDNQSRVMVKKQRFNRIKKGMEARTDNSDAEKSTLASNSSGGDARTNFKAFYAFTPIPITSFNKVSYAAPPASNDSPGSLWGKSEDSGMQVAGLGLEFEMGVATQFSVAFGFRYKMYLDFLVDSDYNLTNKDQYADTSIKAASMGVWFDFYLLHYELAPNFYFKQFVGLDIDQTNLAITSDRLSDAESDEDFNIIDAKANLTLLSMRVGSHFAYVLDPIGFSIGLNLFVPLAEAARSIEGSSEDPNGSRLKEMDQIDDHEASLAIKKASIGAELLISTFVIF